MLMQALSSTSFKGQFNYSKLKSKQAQKLHEILTTDYNGISNRELLKSMPFDVDVVCLNPSKRAIHPRFNFFITHTKKQATLQGAVNINSKDLLADNIFKLNQFINNFYKKYCLLKGDEKLTRAEEIQRQVSFILFGKW